MEALQSERHSGQLTETLWTIQCVSVTQHKPSRAWEDFRANRYIIHGLHPSRSSITTNECTEYEEVTGRTMCHSHYSVFDWRKTFYGKICANYKHTNAWKCFKTLYFGLLSLSTEGAANGTYKLKSWFQSLYYIKASSYNFVSLLFLGSDPIQVLQGFLKSYNKAKD